MSAAHNATTNLTKIVVTMKTIGMSTQKGRKPQTLEDTLKHNLRLIKAEGASFVYNPALSHNNQLLHGVTTQKEGRAYLDNLFKEFGVSPKRNDYVQALELVFTTLPNFSLNTALSYLQASYHWACGYYGEKMVISVVIHLDDDLPHMHVLIAPLVKGEAGYRLGGSQMKRGRAQDEAAKSFNACVANARGLNVKTFQEYTDNKPKRKALSKQIIKHLKDTQAPETKGKLWAFIEAFINRKPELIAKALGLSAHASLADLAASKGKGAVKPKPSISKSVKVRAIEDATLVKHAEKSKSSLCIDFALKPISGNGASTVAQICDGDSVPRINANRCKQPNAHKCNQAQPKSTKKASKDEQTQAENGDLTVWVETVRVRDDQLSAEYFDPTTGEFVEPPAKVIGLAKAYATDYVQSEMLNKPKLHQHLAER